jgi:hypothetical protein
VLPPMKTIDEVLEEVRVMGTECSERSLWKYHKLRLIPGGRKVSGEGNKVFFPEGTALRLWLVRLLTDELGFSLSDVVRLPWSQLEGRRPVWSSIKVPGELVLAVRDECNKARDKLLLQLVGKLVTDWKS